MKLRSVIYYYFKLLKLLNSHNILGSWRLYKISKKILIKDNLYWPVPYFEGWIEVCPAHSMGNRIFFGSLYEEESIKLIRTLVNKGFSFIDVGANIGLHTIAAGLSRHNPEQSIVAFEPNKEISKRLKINTHLNNLTFILIVEKALGDVSGTLPFYNSKSKNKGKNSLLKLEDTVHDYDVAVTTMDKELFGLGINYSNLIIKIDTEGYEYKVLLGAKDNVLSSTNCFLFIELSPDFLTISGISIQELKDKLKEFGFTYFIKLPIEEKLKTFGENSNQENIIFVKGNDAKNIVAENYSIMPIIDLCHH